MLEEEGIQPATARVLVADDHELTRDGLVRMLTSGGFEVVGEAKTGNEALQLAEEFKPDIVIMDAHMPDMDGLTATKLIKESQPRTAIIIFSGYQGKDDLRRAVEAGASGYLSKTASKANLAQAISIVLGGGSLIDTAALHDLLQEMRGGAQTQGVRRSPLGLLSPRETEVLRLLTQGLTNKEIAQQMHYSVGTVKNVVQRIIENLSVSDRTQAAVLAVREGLFGEEERQGGGDMLARF